jgi:hypothetical protein
VKDKCNICHRTKSPKNPWIRLEVSCKAISAHIDHGDYAGTCVDAAQQPNFTGKTITESMLVHDHDQTVDSRCEQVRLGCEPALVISTDKLRDYSEGPSETESIGEYLMTNANVADYVIAR